MTVADAQARLRAWDAGVAVIFGSGLAGVPAGATVEDEIYYPALGWPAAGVAGHGGVLKLAVVPRAGGDLRMALACGRPHGYEGWDDAELERPVRDLAAAGVRGLVLTNSTGSLRPDVPNGVVVVCSGVVDLTRAPEGEAPPALPVCSPDAVGRVVEALGGAARARAGDYVAVPGPQFETPAEVAWLARYGDVVGMSAAPEVRAAHATGVECCLLALVANAAGEVTSHLDVLSAGRTLAHVLETHLFDAVVARWPAVA